MDRSMGSATCIQTPKQVEIQSARGNLELQPKTPSNKNLETPLATALEQHILVVFHNRELAVLAVRPVEATAIAARRLCLKTTKAVSRPS